MMERAGQAYGLRGVGLAILIALATWGGVAGYGILRADALVDSLKTAGTADVPPIIKQLSEHRRWAVPRLRRLVADSDKKSRDHLHASLALVEIDPSQVDYLFGRLLSAGPGDLPVFIDFLRPHRSQLIPDLWSELEAAQPGDAGLLPCASTLAFYDPEGSRWDELSGKVAEALVSVDSLDLGSWLKALSTLREKLSPQLAVIFRDKQRTQDVHAKVADILAMYAQNDPDLLAKLLAGRRTRRRAVARPSCRVAEVDAAKAIPVFQAELGRGRTIDANPADSEPVKDELAARQARAAVALIRLGHAGDVWPLLRHSPDPRLRSFIVNWLGQLGADPHDVAAELARLDPFPPPAFPEDSGQTPTVDSSVASTAMDSILFNPDTSTRRALILALGINGDAGLPSEEREPLVGKLLNLYENDPDAGCPWGD